MPDLILYRRHAEDCPGARRGREFTRCKCPVWCDGRIEGKRVNHSMKTRDWDRAERRMLGTFDPGASARKRKLLTHAIDDYLADCSARGLTEGTVRGYRTTLAAMLRFAEVNGARHADQITLDFLTAFRVARRGRDNTSEMTSGTKRKELETIRCFCRFSLRREWMKSNAAMDLKQPKDTTPPTLPFEQEEIERIMAAVEEIRNANMPSALRARLRTKAALLLMLHAGLRVSDVAILERSKINFKTGRMFIRVMKTGVPLTIKLQQPVLDALKALPIESKRYFLWTGNGKVTSIIGSLRRSIDCVLALAGVEGHPHRFRDTFAVRLLNEDTPIRTVQLLLGHQSVQTTERHYAHFVHSQQRLLDSATDKLDYSSGSGLQDKVTEKSLGNAKRGVLAFPA